MDFDMDFPAGTVIVRHFRGSRTGDRVVEGTSLENWHRRKPIEGSNPSLSATCTLKFYDHIHTQGCIFRLARFAAAV
jgi:hypothetical protein